MFGAEYLLSAHDLSRRWVCCAQSPKVTEARAFNGFGTNFEGSPEPIYGSVFLPRKFKVQGSLGNRIDHQGKLFLVLQQPCICDVHHPRAEKAYQRSARVRRQAAMRA